MKTLIKAIIICLVLSCLLCQYSTAQRIDTRGKEFWVGFMQNHVLETPVLTLLISGDKATTGTVEIPAALYSQPFAVAPGAVTTVTIPEPLGHITGSESITNKGIYIQAADTINVFASSVIPFTTDASLVLPIQALDKEYYAMTYSDNMPEFLIVATEDNTDVQITPSSATLTGRPANAPFTITLNRGQAYQVQASAPFGDNGPGLAGSLIKSLNDCKPIAVFGGNTCCNVPVGSSACDHLYEQMFPIKSWGLSYLTVPLETRVRDTYRIMAAKNATTYRINNGPVKTLQAGKFHEVLLSTPSVITATKPVSVAQFCNSIIFDNSPSGDPFVLMLMPQEQGINNISFSTIAGNNKDHFVNIVSPTSNVGDIRLNGASIAGSFSPYAANPDYSSAQVTLGLASSVATTYTLTSPQNITAYVYGFGYADSYGYAAGGRIDNIAFDFTHSTPVCAGANITFNAILNYTPLAFTWDFGDGSPVSTLQDPTHVFAANGTYTVKLKVQNDACSFDSITKLITIDNTLIANAGSDRTICKGDSVQLTASGGSIYSWAPSTGLSDPAIANPFAKPDTTTSYIVSVSDNICPGSATDTITVFVISNLQPPAVNDTTICKGQSVVLSAAASYPGATVTWWDAATGGTQLESGPSYDLNAVTAPVTIYVQTELSNCKSPRDSLLVSLDEPMAQPLVTCFANGPDSVRFTWNRINGADRYQVSTDSGLTWLDPSSGTTSYDTVHIAAAPVAPPREVTLLVKALGPLPCGNSLNSEAVTCQPQDCPQIDPALSVSPASVTQGDSVTIQAAPTGGIGPYAYSWNPFIGTGPGPYTVSPAATTTYTVTVTDLGSPGCPPVTDMATVTVDCNVMQVAIVADTSIEQNQSASIQAVVTGGIGPFDYVWNPDIGNGAGPFMVQPPQTMPYQVTVTDLGAPSCPSASDMVMISVDDDFFFHVPNAFSPNDDSWNDEFKGYGKNIREYYLRVYDRWGSLIYESRELNQGWNGKIRGTTLKAPDGTYIYLITFKDPEGKTHTYYGTVNLVK